jgi:hypothetical protein
MPSQIRISCTVEPETDLEPEGCFSTGNPDDDRETCRRIRHDFACGNTWAWCRVQVEANFWGFEGRSSWLGACSYEDEEDFRKPGDYFDDLRGEAIADLREQIENAAGGADPEADPEHARAALAALYRLEDEPAKPCLRCRAPVPIARVISLCDGCIRPCHER